MEFYKYIPIDSGKPVYFINSGKAIDFVKDDVQKNSDESTEAILDEITENAHSMCLTFKSKEGKLLRCSYIIKVHTED